MRRILIRHLSGSKANQIDTLTFENYREVLIGRDHEACRVSYDEERDEKVGRRHARILQDSREPGLFTIEDLQSRNGTFVDGSRIDGPTPLRHGANVQLGRTGPEFLFLTDPPPPGPKPTFAESGNSPARDVPWWEQVRKTIGDWAPAARYGTGSRWTPAFVMLCSAAALFCVIFIAGIVLYLTKPKSPVGLLEANRQSIVSIDVVWRLFDASTGRQAYHWQVQNPFPGDAHAQSLQGKSRLPVFVRMAGAAVEPVLILNDEKETNRPLGGRVFGSGCIVDQKGFILTSGAVAAPFAGEYVWPRETLPALLVDLDDQSVSVTTDLPRGWVPAGPQLVVTRGASLESLRLSRSAPARRALQGRLESATIAFSGSENRTIANLVGTSEDNSFSLFKIEPVRALRAAEVARANGRLAVADRAYVMGFGAGPRPSKEVAVRLAAVVKLSDPKTAGRGVCPGCYQISDSGADPGYAGGPVFDDRGRVVGVFQPHDAGPERTFWIVPVERALGLLGIGRK